MQKMLVRYASSNQPVRLFCKTEGIQECVFYYWRRRQQDIENRGKLEEPKFKQLRLSQRTRIDLVLGQGLKLGLEGIEMSQLAELLIELDRQHA
jgi:hypothetical protein